MLRRAYHGRVNKQSKGRVITAATAASSLARWPEGLEHCQGVARTLANGDGYICREENGPRKTRRPDAKPRMLRRHACYITVLLA